MGYGQLAEKRKNLTQSDVSVEKQCEDPKPVCSIPVYSVLFTPLVCLCTYLLGSTFFVYKWIVCLNYLIGKNLFRASALTVVWVVLLVIGFCSMLGGSWLLIVAWLGYLAYSVYLVSQLRKCRTYSLSAQKWLKRLFILFCVLWFLAMLSGSTLFTGCVMVVETGVLQGMFNLALYDVSEEHGLFETKIKNDWLKFRLVAVWCLVGLSVVLFLSDVIVTVLRIMHLAGCTYHGFNLDGKFHFWLFFEDYCPHAGWQLCLWCAAALIGLVPLRLAIKTAKDSFFACKGFLASLFPNVAGK